MIRTMALSALVLTLTALPAAGEAGRHSGRVVQVGDGGRSIVIEEMGPWQGPNTGLSTRTVQLEPGTSVRLVVPTGKWEEDASPGYELRTIAVEQLQPGDFVTVMLNGAGGAARGLDVMRADGDAAAASPALAPRR